MATKGRLVRAMGEQNTGDLVPPRMPFSSVQWEVRWISSMSASDASDAPDLVWVITITYINVNGR